MDALTKLVYRSLLRSAHLLDSRPALQALIHKDQKRDDLPKDFVAVLSRFLGGEHRLFRMPWDQCTITETIQGAFRHPPVPSSIDSGLIGMRYLSGILRTAEKHDLLPDKQAKHLARAPAQQQDSQQYDQVSPQALPGTGSILVSHALVHPRYFLHQSVTLICNHSLTSGAYGLTLNRLQSKSTMQIFEGKEPSQTRSDASEGAAGFNLARDFPVALHAFLDSRDKLASDDMEYIMNAQDSYCDNDEPESDSEVVDVQFESSGADVDVESSDELADDDSDPSLPRQPQQTWRAKLIDASPSRSFKESQDGPDVTGDIADPRHPLRYHQVVSNLRRNKYPGLSSTGSHATPTSHRNEVTELPDPPAQGAIQHRKPPEKEQLKAGLQSSSALSQNQEPSSPEQLDVSSDMQSSQEIVAGDDDSSEQEPLSADDEQYMQSSGSSADSQAVADAVPPYLACLQDTLDQIPDEILSPDRQASKASLQRRISELTAFLGKIEAKMDARTQQYSQAPTKPQELSPVFDRIEHLNDLFELSVNKHISRGGPEPGGQVLHDHQELGGEVVLEPFASHSGLFVGADFTQIRQASALSQEPIENLRFFAGEAMWVSNQLEAELAQGKWMLLTPTPELLHRIALHPHSFDPEPEDDDGQRHKRVRQEMWSYVLHKAGPAYADLSSISLGLVEDLQELQY